MHKVGIVLSNVEIAPIIEVGDVTIGCPSSQGNIGGNYSNFYGEQVRIYCRLIDGFPIPTITWFYEDTELIMFSDNFEINITVENDTIGEYRCIAANILGFHSVTSYVDIQC